MLEQEGGILSPEQVEELRTRVERKKEKSRGDKRKAKAKRDAEKELEQETPLAFWRKNKAVASQIKIAAYEERQSFVFQILTTMDDAINGRHAGLLLAEDVDEDVRGDVKEHGVCDVEVALLDFWKNETVFANLTQQDSPTAVFVRYGLVTAIPGHRLHNWQSWFQQRGNPTTRNNNGYTTMLCVYAPGCQAMPDAVPVSIAEAYQELKKPYKCHACLARERAAIKEGTIVRTTRKDIFDGYGKAFNAEEI